MYERCLGHRAGKPADYIPQLARVDPAKWGVSLCTIDGQRFSVGDVKEQFSIQSTRSAGAPLSINLNTLEDRYKQSLDFPTIGCCVFIEL